MQTARYWHKRTRYQHKICILSCCVPRNTFIGKLEHTRGDWEVHCQKYKDLYVGNLIKLFFRVPPSHVVVHTSISGHGAYGSMICRRVGILHPQKLIHRINSVIIRGKLATTEPFLQFQEEAAVRGCQIKQVMESTILDGGNGRHWLVSWSIISMKEHPTLPACHCWFFLIWIKIGIVCPGDSLFPFQSGPQAVLLHGLAMSS